MFPLACLEGAATIQWTALMSRLWMAVPVVSTKGGTEAASSPRGGVGGSLTNEWV